MKYFASRKLSSDTWTQKHFLNPSSDLNNPAHKKLKGSTSSGDSCSDDSQQKTPPASLFNFTQADYNSAFGPMANMLASHSLAQQAKTSPAVLKLGTGVDLNGALKPQMFDSEFMKLAATNPLFRFSDFASTAASNPYFTNLFRSQVSLENLNIPIINEYNRDLDIHNRTYWARIRYHRQRNLCSACYLLRHQIHFHPIRLQRLPCLYPQIQLHLRLSATIAAITTTTIPSNQMVKNHPLNHKP